MASLNDELVQQLLEGRYIATLGTHSPDGSIHMVSVWYWFDGSHLYVATSSRSRKARNVQFRLQASIMIDSRDPAASCGVNLAGDAQILSGALAAEKREQVHRKYLSAAALADPTVGPIFAAFDDVVVQITPATVIAWDMRMVDRQFFGGAMERNPSYLFPLLR
jgi:nitroimidazol reductase NimA-like FMN-containing flavoprotein (pyridoxamine 5'-phosphate oxidase superfamily)